MDSILKALKRILWSQTSFTKLAGRFSHFILSINHINIFRIVLFRQYLHLYNFSLFLQKSSESIFYFTFVLFLDSLHNLCLILQLLFEFFYHIVLLLHLANLSSKILDDVISLLNLLPMSCLLVFHHLLHKLIYRGLVIPFEIFFTKYSVHLIQAQVSGFLLLFVRNIVDKLRL